MREPSSPWRLVALLTAVLAVGGLAAVGWVLATGAPSVSAELLHELRDRGRIAVVGGEDLARLGAEGAELTPSAQVPGLDAALDGDDVAALDAALQENGIGGLLVDGRGPAVEGAETLREKLRAYQPLDAVRGVYLTPTASLYVRRRGLALTDEHREALARAARQIVGGARTPRLRAFPEPLRRTTNVEVLIMLERDGRPRLWRSARGSSIARALITAGSVARQRWIERETAMGGAIDDPSRGLPSLTVRVFLLEEDGTLGDRSNAFVERVFTREHGVAVENRGSWHYLLPQASRDRGDGSAVLAYRELFDDAGLIGASSTSAGSNDEDAGAGDADAGPRNEPSEGDRAARRAQRMREASEVLSRDTLRFYRLLATEVGVSAPTTSRGGVIPSGVDAPAFAPSEFDAL
ncbi:MAG: hypothetical protein AB7S26_28420 [Sandaracinaceae bacterium]